MIYAGALFAEETFLVGMYGSDEELDSFETLMEEREEHYAEINDLVRNIRTRIDRKARENA